MFTQLKREAWNLWYNIKYPETYVQATSAKLPKDRRFTGSINTLTLCLHLYHANPLIGMFVDPIASEDITIKIYRGDTLLFTRTTDQEADKSFTFYDLPIAKQAQTLVYGVHVEYSDFATVHEGFTFLLSEYRKEGN